MLRPEDMTRIVVVGSMDGLDPTVECLYDQGVLHIIDFTEPTQDFKIGSPLPEASDASQKLLKLRAMMRALQLESYTPEQKLTTDEIGAKLEQALVTLDVNSTSKVDARIKIVSLIREKEQEIRALEPFQSFNIPVENFVGYESVSAFAGTCKKDPSEGLAVKLKAFEIFVSPLKGAFAVALFVKNEDKAEASRVLSDAGYQEIKIPNLRGHPAAIIFQNREEIKNLHADLVRIDKDIDGIRKRFADFIIASEEDLAIKVLKAETPLRFATSANSFVIDGWVPRSKLGPLEKALGAACSGTTYMEAIEPEKKEEPPVRLRHTLPVRPYELFINLVLTPKYTEIDPTIILFITFPVFFGLMLGDLGLGLVLLGLGIFFRLKMSGGFKRLGTITIGAAVISILFGLFVYCEAFGVPFHAPADNPEETAWDTVVNIPLHPLINKLTDVKELLAISIAAGWMHMTIGLGFGVSNNWHSKKHALGKLAWLILLFGIFMEIMFVAGNTTFTSKLFNDTLFAPFPSSMSTIIGVKVSNTALVTALVGIALLIVTEGAVVLTEVLTIFANLVSYARLAALAVGHGAMSLAFNTMLFPVIFGDNVVLAVLGALTLGASVAIFVFLLGSLSIGIQAMRLNYYEFFLKFFEGGGTEYSPLGYSRRYSIERT